MYFSVLAVPGICTYKNRIELVWAIGFRLGSVMGYAQIIVGIP